IFFLVLGSVIAVAVLWLSRGTLVTVAVVHRGDAAQVVYATGTVEPVHWAKISALQRKRIVELCKCEGQAVKAGEVLARLDDGEERALLTELQARAIRLRDDAERIRRLVERNVTSRLSLDEKLTQVREYEARIAAQKDRISDLALKSPMDGIVLRRDGEVGEIAGTGANQALLWVGRPKPLRVIAEVNEEDISRVQTQQNVLLRHDGHVGKPLRATVGRITPKGDPQTKTFRVYLRLPQQTPLMIGMSVEANIIIREAKDAVLVPAEAISENTVQIVIDGRAIRRPVQTGIRGTRLVEIKSGLAAGDIVLSPFLAAIQSNASVRIQQKLSQ
ncbi:MAG: efflux RND transporter periplasmic adaptor subunit, partial [Hyphomicrobiaceae bacterium]